MRSAIATTAPSAAHEDTPKVELSAKGFRSSPCMAAPEIERAAPTRADRITRGRRTFNTITIKLSDMFAILPIPKTLLSIIFTVSDREILTLPVDTESKKVKTSIAKHRAMTMCLGNALFMFFFGRSCIGLFPFKVYP